MTNTLSKKILEYTDVQNIVPDLTKLSFLSKDAAEKSQTVIFDSNESTLLVLSTNNLPGALKQVLDHIGSKGYHYEVYYTGMEWIWVALWWYDVLADQQKEKQDAYDAQEHAIGKTAIGMIKDMYEQRGTMKPGDFITEIIRLSFQSGASDLHFQEEEKWVTMRVRIDGIMQDVVVFEHKNFKQYLAKLKFMSGIKVNVAALPQDGRFSFVTRIGTKERTVDARVNTMPSLYDDDIVIRFLDKGEEVKTFSDLGVRDEDYSLIKDSLNKPHGMILVTGPTGSGKTTTLYTMLHTLNNGQKKIITLENPVEYQLWWVQQSQINEDKGYTYEEGLKAILRHDPDIILVWETRSQETAETVINAALTWHLVLTTLHTNNAPESVSRLLSMGVKPYLLAPSLHLICAQRLLRKVCPHCASKQKPNYAEEQEINDYINTIKTIKPRLEIDYDGTIMKPVGCEHCNKTGYKGRVVVLELLEVTDSIKKLIMDNTNISSIIATARQEWFLTMQEDAFLKVLSGQTTLDEVRKLV